MSTRTMRRTGGIADIALRCELDRTRAENVQLRGVIARQNDQIRALRTQLARSIENERQRVRQRENAARLASGGRRAAGVSPEAKE